MKLKLTVGVDDKAITDRFVEQPMGQDAAAHWSLESPTQSEHFSPGGSHILRKTSRKAEYSRFCIPDFVFSIS